MGSFLFKNCDLGELVDVEDFNRLKYTSTKAAILKFHIKKNDREVFKYTSEMFRYLYKKIQFMKDLEKIKFNAELNVTGKDSLTLFLNIEKYLNKYVFARKLIKQNRLPKNNKSTFLIKVNFNDAIYRIKQVKTLYHHTPQLNYFSYFALTNKEYSNKQISEFLLNEENNAYDHLLPIHLQSSNYEYYLEYIKEVVNAKGIDNIKLAPIVIKYLSDSHISELGSEFLKAINSIRLRYIDFAFIIFASNPEEMKILIKALLKKLSVGSNGGYIVRFYLFTNKSVLSNINEFKESFKHALLSSHQKQHSYAILYMFIPKVILCIRDSTRNVYQDEEELDKKLLQDEKEYKKMSNTNYHNPDLNATIGDKILTKNIIKIYTYTMFEIFAITTATYTKSSVLQKLKKKTILHKISKFLTVSLKEKKYNVNDPLVKNCIYYDYLGIQKELSIPAIQHPQNSSQLHDDLVHIHFDQAFNLLKKSS